MATPLAVFRLVAPEFSAVNDDVAETWLELTAPLVSRKRFGKVYEQALALLAAHRMKTAGVGAEDSLSDGFGDLGGVGAAFKIASYGSGGENISFNNAALTSKLSSDAEYSQTTYGIQFITLRKLYTVPIISAGEKRC